MKKMREKRYLFFHGVIFCVLLLLSACTGLLFYPQKEWVITPDKKGYDYQVINIKSSDGIFLNAWLMPQRKAVPKGAVIFFHGNSQNISSHAQQVYWLTDEGYDVLLVDYRGFGHSEGDIDLEKNFSDIAVCIQWFIQHYPETTHKFLIGHSLGAAMAGFVIAEHEELRMHLNAVVLNAGFSGYRRITRDVMSRSWLFALFQYPVSLGFPNDFDLLDVVDHISPTPLLVIHGKGDTVVPYQHGEDIYNKAKEPKEMLSFDGNHVDAFEDIARRKILLHFFEQYQ